MNSRVKPLPTLETLRYHYRYEALTGKLYKRTSTYNKKLKRRVWCEGWREVTTQHSEGYLVVTHDGRQLKAHRIAYALHHGADPYPLEIDHKNEVKTDNRIVNLRAVTPSENCENVTRRNRNREHPVAITYPDGRGTLICNSIATAALILNCKYSRIQLHLRRGNTNPLRWEYQGRRYSSGITIAYTE
jgi:hypothetical protein